MKLGTLVDLDGLGDLQSLVRYYQSYRALTADATVTGKTSFTYALGNETLEKINESKPKML